MSYTDDKTVYATLMHAALDGVIEEAEQDRLIKRARSDAISWGKWFLFVFCFIASVFGTGVLFVFLGSRWVVAIPIVLSYLVFLRLIDRLQARAEQRAMSRILLDLDIRPRICLRCAYKLQGTNSLECPECGEPLAPVMTEFQTISASTRRHE